MTQNSYREMALGIVVAIAVVLVGFLPCSAEQQASPPVTSVGLDLYGEMASLEHPRNEPLLVTVTLENQTAASVRLANANSSTLLETYEREGCFDTLNEKQKKLLEERNKQIPVEPSTIGGAGNPAYSEVKITISGVDGSATGAEIYPLARTKEAFPGSIKLDGSGGKQLYFGVLPESLSDLAPGEYSVTAVFKPDSAGDKVKSNSVKLRLVESSGKGDSDVPRATMLYRYGRYYILDKKFKNAEPYAAKLEELTPESVSAKELLGDALQGQGKTKEASQAFATALERHQSLVEEIRKVDPEALIESPVYLLDRL